MFSSITRTGDRLLSPQGVSSALESFTSLFGIGRGVSPLVRHQIQVLNIFWIPAYAGMTKNDTLPIKDSRIISKP